MGSSYFEQRGMQIDAPITGTNEENYASEGVDLVQPVNENIDATDKLNTPYFESLQDAYKRIYDTGQKRIPDVITWARGEGKKSFNELKEFNEYLGEVDKYDKALSAYRNAEDDIKVNPKAFDQSDLTENQKLANGTGDKQLLKEAEVENNKNVVKKEANAIIQELAPVDIDAASEINQAYIKESFISEDLVEVKNKFPAWQVYANSAFKIHLPEFGYTEEGEPIYYAYNDAIPNEWKSAIRRVTDGWYFKQHEHVARGRLGLYKKEFITWALDQRRAQDKALIEDSVKAFDEGYRERIATDLRNKLQLEGGQAFVDMIQTEAPRFVDPITNLPSSRLSREAHTDNFIDGVELEVLGRTELNKILDTWVQPYYKEGHEPPPKKRFRDQWPKESRRMIAAVAQQEKKELEERKADLDGKKAADTVSIIDWSQQEMRSYEEVQQKVAEFKSEYGITNDEHLPDELKNLMYQGRERDVELDAKLSYEFDETTIAPDINQVRQLTSEKLQKKWRAIIDKKLGLTKEGKGPGSVNQREQTINILSNQHALETNTQVSKTSKWQNIQTNARAAYNAAWRVAKEKDLSDWAAHDAAKTAVEDGLKIKIPILNSAGEPTGRERTAWEVLNSDKEINQLTNQKKAIKAILADKDLINQPEPFKGEEPHLKAGIKYLQKKGPFPAYYHALAQKTGYIGGGKALLRDRLVANGNLKDGELVFPDEENVDSTDLRTLTVNPTPSKTYGLVKGAEDYTWMLKSTQNDDSKENGGYLALKDKNGKWTNIEAVTGKKLDQITYRDVHSLALNGYSHFGMYGLRPQGIVDLVNSGQVPLDGTWDVKDQDLLLLARLRQKTQQAQYNTGIKSRYRRLVNIRKEDQERFKTIAGDLPTYNQLDNLLVECAQEQCNVLLQQ